MSISKSTCNHWHPSEPSEIRVVKRSNRKSGVGEVCATCHRARQRAKYRNKDASNAPPIATPKDYSVLPRLTWPAPEFLLRQ
jgi:hypothetical protein